MHLGPLFCFGVNDNTNRNILMTFVEMDGKDQKDLKFE